MQLERTHLLKLAIDVHVWTTPHRIMGNIESKVKACGAFVLDYSHERCRAFVFHEIPDHETQFLRTTVATPECGAFIDIEPSPICKKPLVEAVAGQLEATRVEIGSDVAVSLAAEIRQNFEHASVGLFDLAFADHIDQ